MSERIVNPQDSIDLIQLLQSYGETLGTLYPQAHVYDQDDSEITGSPFTLSLVANNLYTLADAFQVGDSGTYKVIYLVYTDSGHTARSANHGEIVDIINVKIQSTTGLGGYGSMKNRGGADVIVDMDPIFKAIKSMDKKFDKKVKKLQKDFDKGFKVDIPETDNKELISAIQEAKTATQAIKIPKTISNKEFDDFRTIVGEMNDKVIKAIKKNRSTTIKTKFDKAIVKPIFRAVGEVDLKLAKAAKEIRIDNTKMIDSRNKEIEDNVKKMLNKSLNQLNESIRLKLKFTLEGLKTLLFMGKKPKQEINITLKKDEL